MDKREIETYLTIEEVGAYLKLAAQTIRRYVLNREIPFHKIKKVIRFRLSEIEKWVDEGGAYYGSSGDDDDKETDLFEAAEIDGGASGGNDSGGAV